MISTFIGIAVHNATASNAVSDTVDLAAGVRQDATGLLGTTLQLADLVSGNVYHISSTMLTRAWWAGHSFCRWWVPVHRCGGRLTNVSFLDDFYWCLSVEYPGSWRRSGRLVLFVYCL